MAEIFKQQSPCLGHDGRGGSQQQLLDGDAYRPLWPFARPCTNGIRLAAYRFTEIAPSALKFH
jgi:hypothetical protein